MRKNRRRKILVEKSVQGAIVRQAVGHWLMFSTATVALLAALQVLLGGLFTSWAKHWETIWPMALSVYFALLVLLPMFIHDSLKLSHRFTGPIVKMRRVLREVAEGQPIETVRFRKGDYWPELADEFNAAVDALVRARTVEVEPAAETEVEEACAIAN
jgi:hypothetical protein